MGTERREREWEEKIRQSGRKAQVLRNGGENDKRFLWGEKEEIQTSRLTLIPSQENSARPCWGRKERGGEAPAGGEEGGLKEGNWSFGIQCLPKEASSSTFVYFFLQNEHISPIT